MIQPIIMLYHPKNTENLTLPTTVSLLGAATNMRFITAYVLWNLSDRFTAAKRYEIEFPWGERVVMSQRAKEMLETMGKVIEAQIADNGKLASLDRKSVV